MSKKKSDTGSDLESLFKQAIDINTRYFKEGTEVVKRMSSSGRSGADLNLFKPEQVASAFTELARLNLKHYQNVLDLGMNLTRQAVSGSEAADSTTAHEPETGSHDHSPAFVLAGTLNAKRQSSLDFLLDNTLDKEVRCEFRHSPFVSDSDDDEFYRFSTVFSPQSFLMPPGNSRKITIEIEAQDEVSPGNYTSRVEVLGFEPLYFLIKLNVPEQSTQKSGDGKKKNKR